MNVVRPASPADAPRIVQFQLSMALETEDLALDPAIVASGVAAVFEDPAKGRYWVAERGRQTGQDGLRLLPDLLERPRRQDAEVDVVPLKIFGDGRGMFLAAIPAEEADGRLQRPRVQVAEHLRDPDTVIHDHFEG